MEIDYRDAAKRHWEDAESLETGKRFANADQLYGLAAECALKGVMVTLGAPGTAGGDLERDYWFHIDGLWSEYKSFAAGRRGSRYLSPLSAFEENPFDDWRVHQRYAADTEAPSGAVLIRHAKATKACLVCLQRAGES